ncbi:twin transmembrane helix small protein [Maricaulis sp.]|uniref:twin transmembrane helix small protein n=1 Tax=Maricaulis sp. TaxID=1486257 RepID=UPI003A8CCC7C
MDTFLTGLLYIAMLAVLVTLGFGVFNMYKSDDKARSRSNKLMRLRVVLQFAAVLLIVAIFLVKENLGG